MQNDQLEFCFEAPAPGGLDKEAARRERRNAASRRYRKSERGKAVRKHWLNSAKEQSRRSTWNKSEAGRIYWKQRNGLPQTKAVRKAWQQSTKTKIRQQIERATARMKRCLAGKQRGLFPDAASRHRFRRATNKQFAIASRLRSRIAGALKRRKVSKSMGTAILLGCSIQEFVAHLENKFLPGMTWGNRSLWHVDHIVPCDAFDLRREDEQKRCFHYTNLRPLWGGENLKKSAFMQQPRQLPLLAD